MTLVLRDATVADADTIAAVMLRTKAESWPELLEAHDRDAALTRARWARYLTTGSQAQQALGDGFVLLAEREGVPSGFAAWHHTARHGADAELQAIYVLPDAQRTGVGTALLRAVAGRLAAEGARSLCVGYDPRNPFAAFYRKHGAEEIDPHWAIWRDVRRLA